MDEKVKQLLIALLLCGETFETLQYIDIRKQLDIDSDKLMDWLYSHKAIEQVTDRKILCWRVSEKGKELLITGHGFNIEDYDKRRNPHIKRKETDHG